MNVEEKTRLEFELTYYNVQQVRHSIIGTPDNRAELLCRVPVPETQTRIKVTMVLLE